MKEIPDTTNEGLDPAEQRRTDAKTEGSGMSNFVATGGAPIEHEDFPTRNSAPQPRATRRGTPRQVDDALDELIPPGKQNPQYKGRTAEEVSRQQAVNSRGRTNAGVGAAKAKRRSLETSFKEGEIDELTLNALKQKYGSG